MLCEKCRQREASIVLTEIMNGVRTEHNLCRSCAAKLKQIGFSDMDFPFQQLISEILGIQSDSENLHFEQLEQLSCPTCGTSYRDFVQNSCFGCADCYETFGLLIENNIKKMQGSNVHIGKRPKFHREKESIWNENPADTAEESETPSLAVPLEEQIELLRARIQEAISEENYEQAAKFRDEIKKLTRNASVARAANTNNGEDEKKP